MATADRLGGKSDLAIGKALMRHHEVLIMRREATQLKGILRRMEQLLGSRDGYNGQDRRWSKAGPREVDIGFCSRPNLGDETKHQGNPHDLLVLDEATNFLESQVNFLLGRNSSYRARGRALPGIDGIQPADLDRGALGGGVLRAVAGCADLTYIPPLRACCATALLFRGQ